MNAIVLALAMASAVPPPASDTRAALIGTWQSVRKIEKVGDVVVELTFAPNGSFRGYLTVNGQVYWNYAGTWTLNEDRLDYLYTKSDRDDVPVGKKDRDQVLEVTKKYFRIKCLTGEERTYTRVKREEK